MHNDMCQSYLTICCLAFDEAILGTQRCFSSLHYVLIVFDEATSALDNVTESEVMAAINTLPGHKTVLIIAHRLSTVANCDRIVVMEAGRIVACDSWDRLMDGNETFRKIVQISEDAAE